MSQQQEIREQLSAYLDGELKGDQVRRVEQALSQDPALAAELAALRHTRELLRKLPRQHAGEDFAARLLDRAERMRLIGQVHPATRRRFISWSWLATAAAVLIVAGAGIFVTFRLTTVQTFQKELARNGGPVKTAQGPRKDYEYPSAKPTGEALPVPERGAAASAKKAPGPEKPTEGLFAAARTKDAGGTDKAEIALARVPAAPAIEAASGLGAKTLDVEAHDWSGAENVVIYTDDLPAAQREVESLLAGNAITNAAQLVPAVEGTHRLAAGTVMQEVGGLAQSVPAEPQANQLRIVALVPSRQMEQLQNELRAIRAKQVPSQEQAQLHQAGYYLAPPPRQLSQPCTRAGEVKAVEGKELAEAQTHALPAGASDKMSRLAPKLGFTAEREALAEAPRSGVGEPTSQPVEELRPLVITVNLKVPAATPAAATAPATQVAAEPETQPTTDSVETSPPNDESDQ